MFKQIFQIYKNPSLFYQTLNEDSILPAFKLYAMWSIILMIGYGIMYAISLGIQMLIYTAISGSQTSDALAFGAGLGAMGVMTAFFIPVIYVILLAMPFITAAIMHIFLLFFPNKGYSKTLQVILYNGSATAPLSIIGFIPLVGGLISLAVSIYSMFLTVVGFAKIHNIKYWQAAVPLIVMTVLTVLLIATIVVLAFAGIFSSFVF